ncbi:MAG: DUF4097 domain-containing protein [Clostridia bacterium]|nr:DUF4097 domain-containing protein [Clostridia bacterium]
MKRKTFLPIALSALLFFAGCSESETFTAKTYSENASAVKEITLDVQDRAIDVVLSDDNQIRIDYLESEKDFYDISLSNGTLTMTSAADKSASDYIGTKTSAENRKITLYIPDSSLASLDISTTNENISLSPVSLNSASLSANGGNIFFEEMNAAESINLSVKNGDISGTVIGGWDDFAISTSVKKGECNLPAEKSGGSKTLSASANNGDINIEFVKD